ncbi:PilZ domain-containing protein [Aromatoleum petrolei]|uniref:Cyclic diguanosine monophosphate-binding protein n=1 Tax=Aromatoleum petrolei TaxID=76116 RepID=A0ABX1MUH4_9RHOO|nr:PilZ domain-containing protein [Aromatoleum petrolei]NMF91628.1 PilZ domain-containing protein [Aromatoleum petrolei]QTQ35988.1 Cyclic diguanosine monophosphate-binding protein [Aromatoleum petrolei]
MPQAQRRHFSRIRFDCGARLLVGNREAPCEVSDLSLKGALIRTANDLHPSLGERCLLEIALNDEGATIRMEGDVAHAGSGCIGLACREIDLDSVTHLRRLLELNLGDAELLQRELGALQES